jgi:hypothetical protein
MNALAAKSDSTLVLTPSVDHSAKSGYLATFSGETATLSASATVPATLIILDGQATTGKDTCAVLGNFPAPVLMKSSGVITKGALVQQSTDGSVVTDATTGARVIVGVAMQSAVSGDLFMVAPIGPVIYTS